jgi:hypothetical protein
MAGAILVTVYGDSLFFAEPRCMKSVYYQRICNIIEFEVFCDQTRLNSVDLPG